MDIYKITEDEKILLIRRVEEHELLYNPNAEGYNDIEKRKEIWAKIGSELNYEASDCEREWNILKKRFIIVSDKSAFGPHLEWNLEIFMSFLLPFIKPTSNHHRKSSSRASLVLSYFPVTGPPPTPEQAREQALFNEDIMKLVFKHSELKTQNSIRLVCKQWNAMAHEFWANSTYMAQMKMGKENVSGCIADIKMLPLLKTFRCLWEDEKKTGKVMECVLQNVEDLHHLHLVNISPVYVRAAVQKYKNLKSVAIGENSPDLLQSIALFGKCSELEKLLILQIPGKKKNESNYPEICKVIGQKMLELKEFGSMSVTNCDTVRELNRMIKKKNQNLTSLKLPVCHYSRSISEAVNTCSNLESLDLELYSPRHSFKLVGFPQLKNLSLAFKGDYKQKTVTHTLGSDAAKATLKNLERLTLQTNDKDYNLGMLEFIAKNFSNLKKLRLIGVDKQTLNSQLKYLPMLSDLHTLQINNAKITIHGIEYITECKSIKSLKLIDCQLDKGIITPLITCLSLDKLQFSPSDIFFETNNNCLLY